MTLEINDKGKYYMYKNTNWVKVKDGWLTFNYVEDGEVHEEFGTIPEYFRVMDCE